MRIRLIRHGATTCTEQRRYQGALDTPLSAAGRRAMLPAEDVPRRVYVTPLRRTAETAAILFPGAAQIVVPDLREMDFGDFEGRNYREMADDAAYRAWVDGGCAGRCPHGEDRLTFERRTRAAFARLVEDALAAGEEELVVVAHGGTQMAVMSRWARPARDYFAWCAAPGAGYELTAEEWPAALTLAGEVRYTEDT
jgi:alpha-ribazole phosphatase